MKRIEKLNITTKMLLVLIYSFVLLLAAVFIINIADAREENKGYSTKARDEYIQIYSKIVEMRNEPKDDSENVEKERLQSSIYTQITQTTNKEVKNIELYVTAETHDGTKIYYEETRKANSNYKGLPCKNTTYFKTSPGFNKQNNYSSSKNEYTKTNTTPKIVFIDVYYDVVISNTETLRKQLKYYFLPINADNENFENYEFSETLQNKTQKTVNTKQLSDYLTVKLKYVLADPNIQTDATKNDNFEIVLSANEKKFAEVGKYVVNSKIALFAKGQNHSTDTEEYFSDYILISENVGVLVDKGNSFIEDSVKNSLTNTYIRTSNISENYKVDELYLSISVTLNTGETIQLKTKFGIER